MEEHGRRRDLRRKRRLLGRRLLGSRRAAAGRPLGSGHAGPGTRIPALIVSPYAKKGFVDHTQYDTTSILRFITKCFNLPSLPGITARAAALVANGAQKMGDLTNALDFSQ